MAVVSVRNGDGSAVYFVDGQKAANATDFGYGTLECETPSESGLRCEEDGMRNWVGCGLVLDIAKDGGTVPTGDGMNCTAVNLGVVFDS